MSQDGPGNGDLSAPVPSAPTEAMPKGFLAEGQVVGERYQILEMLGRGGMGEVWHALDLKLRVEVALKALRPEFFKSERRLELLRQEVRAAREVMSPNVCRIFDLIEIEGRELVSMEYVDGATLLAVLQERGPLELKEAQDIASQFLAGLEAIHKAGLIHRDIKPENIMLTRAGRVVVMDFGLAREETEGGGTVAGTPAYMAPEQVAGQQLDARADVYSAGVVLAEMVSPEGIKSSESRQSVWEGVRSEPAKLPDSPWAPVIQRAVARDRERRQNSAHTLIRELEDVTLRVEGAEDLHPYPGLASFTEEDAEYFFGREAEVEQMWRKLDRPHLLALAGPSGAGKSSFLRAGLIPSAGPGWGILRFTPGNTPFTALGQSLAREMAGDVEAMELLARGHEPEALAGVVSRWRKRHDHVLLIVDQFEELFTHCSSEEQQRFSDLIGRLPVEGDAFVLLAMRDDFLIRCREHEALAPAFSELTAILPPTGGALRRAVVQPATTCGYRFEDDELVEEILAEVEGERGALPLLAFALARLWQQRDREGGLLTRQAYHDVGGVGGALARHAESTIDCIGSERVAHVRELFRNLVTSEGTRSVREWDELLSVFEEGHRGSAEEVLDQLIDARLLTSYEVRDEDSEPTRRVEIIHESLLVNWPRLVRWQTQDAEGAQIRDELRQSARAWDEHGRSDDRLWTGTAFREYELWRERYPGGLTEIEEAFSASMTDFAGRRRRRRRLVVAAVLAIFATVAAVTTSLWRRSVLHERRAEAQKLIALGTLEMDDYPTAALVYATQSLQLADSEEARLLALEALWQGPTAFIVNEGGEGVSFSPGGSWLVLTRAKRSDREQGKLALVSSTGEQRVVDLPPGSAKIDAPDILFGAEEDLFFSQANAFAEVGETIALWSAREGRVLASAQPANDSEQLRGKAIFADEEGPVALFTRREGNLVHVETLRPDGRHEILGTIRLAIPAGKRGRVCVPKMTGAWLGVVEGNEVSIVDVGPDGLSEKHLLGRHEGDLFSWCDPDPFGRFLVTVTRRSGQMKLWDAAGVRPPTTADDMRGFYYSNVSHDGSHFFGVDSFPLETLADAWIWSVDGGEFHLRRRIEGIEQKRWPDFDPVGLHFAMAGPSPATRLWSLGAPAAADPILLRLGKGTGVGFPYFSPDGQWLNTGGGLLWPLVRSNPAVIRLDLIRWVGGLQIGPEERYVATAADASVSLFPLDGPVPPAGHTVYEVDNTLRLFDLAISPDGELFAVTGSLGQVWIGRDDGGGAELLEDVGGTFVDFSPDGKLLALVNFESSESSQIQIVIWDVAAARQVAELQLEDGEIRWDPVFVSDGRLLTATSKGVVAWDVETGDHEVLVELDVYGFEASEDGHRLLVSELGGGGMLADPAGSPLYYDLDSGVVTRLETHGTQVWSQALDRKGTVVATGDRDGVIRVGRATGEKPHLLFGHESSVALLAIDPRGRWIASAGADNTVRIWPMPDLSKPPLHTLPRSELIAKLESLTNIRVVRDPESSTGWKIEVGPFPGWKTVPSW